MDDFVIVKVFLCFRDLWGFCLYLELLMFGLGDVGCGYNGGILVWISWDYDFLDVVFCFLIG